MTLSAATVTMFIGIACIFLSAFGVNAPRVNLFQLGVGLVFGSQFMSVAF